MERTILLKLPEELYQQVLKLAAEISRDKGKTFRPGDVIRAMISYSLASEKK